jgi:hypothetical protein
MWNLTRLRGLFSREETAEECMYGNTAGALDNCEIVVQPGRGCRLGSLVFCSEDHARRDQVEAAF